MDGTGYAVCRCAARTFLVEKHSLADGRRTAYEVLQVRDEADQVVVQAAYRVLAAKYHPDYNTAPGAERRMAELNDAYASIRSAERRAVYDKTRRPIEATRAQAPGRGQATSPPTAAGARTRATSNDTVDFGRYAGWSLADLAVSDPDYLRWLGRHSSGIRYRQRIDALLRDRPKPTTSSKVRGR